MSLMPDHERDILEEIWSWQEPAHESYSRSAKDLEYYVNMIDNCQILRECRRMNTIWSSKALQEWLGSTEKRVFYLDGIFEHNGEPTTDSYVTAGVAKFLVEKLNYPVLSCFALSHKKQQGSKGTGKADTVDMLRLLAAQLLYQISHKRPEINVASLLRSRKNWGKVQDNESTLLGVIHDILAPLPEDDAVYIVVDIGFAKCRKQIVKDIIDLTKRPGAVVKVFISQPDQQNLYLVMGESHDSKIYLEDRDIDDEASSGIDLKGKTYKEWESAMERTPLSTGVRKNNPELVRVEDGADSCWETRMDALANY